MQALRKRHYPVVDCWLISLLRVDVGASVAKCPLSQSWGVRQPFCLRLVQSSTSKMGLKF